MYFTMGVDFGQHKTALAVLDESEASDRYFLLSEGKATSFIVSCVAYTDRGIVFGASAKNQADQNRSGTFFGHDIYTFLGKTLACPKVQRLVVASDFKVHSPSMDKLVFVVKDRTGFTEVSPEQILAEFFKYLKCLALRITGKIIDKVAFSVPRDATSEKLEAFKQAFHLAGLRPVVLVANPLAVSISSGIALLSPPKKILFLDFGASALRVSIWDSNDALSASFMINCFEFGGIALTRKFTNAVVGVLQAYSDVRDNMNSLEMMCERTKYILGTEQMAVMGFFNGSMSIQIQISQALWHEVLDQSFQLTRDVLLELEKKRGFVDIFISGGGSQIPWVKNELSNMFPHHVIAMVPDIGSAAIGSLMHCRDFILHERAEFLSRIMTSDPLPHDSALRSVENQSDPLQTDHVYSKPRVEVAAALLTVQRKTACNLKRACRVKILEAQKMLEEEQIDRKIFEAFVDFCNKLVSWVDQTAMGYGYLRNINRMLHRLLKTFNALTGKPEAAQ